MNWKKLEEAKDFKYLRVLVSKDGYKRIKTRIVTANLSHDKTYQHLEKHYHLLLCEDQALLFMDVTARHSADIERRIQAFKNTCAEGCPASRIWSIGRNI